MYRAMIAALVLMSTVLAQPRRLQNIGYVGRGYNIFTGDPHASEVDRGFKAPIFSISYKQGRVSSDQRFKIPDGIHARQGLFCAKKFMSTTVEKAFEYKRVRQESVTVGGGPIGVPFSASPGFRLMSNHMLESNNIFVESLAYCERYEAFLEMYNRPEFTDEFKLALKDLPRQYIPNDVKNNKKFWRFFRTFGTHIATNVKFGSRVAVRHEVMEQGIRFIEENKIDISTAISAITELQFGIVSSVARDDRETAHIKQFLLKSERFSIGGGLASFDLVLDDDVDWMNLTDENYLVPVRYQLERISWALPKHARVIDAALKDFCNTIDGAICNREKIKPKLEQCPPVVYRDGEWFHDTCVPRSSAMHSGKGWTAVECSAPNEGFAGLQISLPTVPNLRSTFAMRAGCTDVKTELGDHGPGLYPKGEIRDTSKIRKKRFGQRFGCPKHQFIAGLRFSRKCLSTSQQISLRCRRAADGLHDCDTTEWADKLNTNPSWTKIECPHGKVLHAMEFRSRTGSNEMKYQQIRLDCCGFKRKCEPFNGDTFDLEAYHGKPFIPYPIDLSDSDQ